ncbi:MAG: transcriptional repressor LexA [Desulfobacula sp.]|nr:transcriptional repressor LexA [Desulfobacula sp.]
MNFMEGLTSIQKNVFSFITTHMVKEGIPPTLDEIAVNFNYKSINTVRDHLRLIANKGYIKVHPGKSRGIQVLKVLNDIIRPEQRSCHDQIPIIGKIAAGAPILANQETEDYLKIPTDFLSSGHYFALHVTGDSMKNIGINTGDIAIIRHQSIVENGEVAAVILEDEATLKRFFKYTDRVELRSENPEFSNIVIPKLDNSHIRIAGKLAGLLTRKINA